MREWEGMWRCQTGLLSLEGQGGLCTWLLEPCGPLTPGDFFSAVHKPRGESTGPFFTSALGSGPPPPPPERCPRTGCPDPIDLAALSSPQSPALNPALALALAMVPMLPRHSLPAPLFLFPSLPSSAPLSCLHPGRPRFQPHVCLGLCGTCLIERRNFQVCSFELGERLALNSKLPSHEL